MSVLNQGRNEIRFNNSDGKCLLENWVEEVRKHISNCKTYHDISWVSDEEVGISAGGRLLQRYTDIRGHDVVIIQACAYSLLRCVIHSLLRQ